jgi:hypothetical protein
MMSSNTSTQAPSASAPLVRYHSSAVRWPSMFPPSVGATSSGMVEKNASHNHNSSQEERARRAPLSSSDLSLAPPSSDPAPPHPTTVPPEIYSSQFTVQSGGGGGGRGAGRRNSASSLPASSQPASTAATLAPPTQGTSTQPLGAATVPHDEPMAEKMREAFLESLREAPELYSLTRPELDNLVSVVVREPGFPKLVCYVALFFFFFFFLREYLSRSHFLSRSMPAC